MAAKNGANKKVNILLTLVIFIEKQLKLKASKVSIHPGNQCSKNQVYIMTFSDILRSVKIRKMSFSIKTD